MSPAEPARELRTASWPAAPSRVRLCELAPSPAVTVLQVTGEIDLAEAEEIRRRMLALLRAPGNERVGLDLSGVGFLGSHGLTAVVRSARAAAQQGVALFGVTGPGNRAIVRPIRMTGLDQLIDWYPDLGTALEHHGT